MCIAVCVHCNTHVMEQPPQGHGRVPITWGFQDAAGQGARWSHPGSLCHDLLAQGVFWGPSTWAVLWFYEKCFVDMNWLRCALKGVLGTKSTPTYSQLQVSLLRSDLGLSEWYSLFWTVSSVAFSSTSLLDVWLYSSASVRFIRRLTWIALAGIEAIQTSWEYNQLKHPHTLML